MSDDGPTWRPMFWVGLYLAVVAVSLAVLVMVVVRSS